MRAGYSATRGSWRMPGSRWTRAWPWPASWLKTDPGDPASRAHLADRLLEMGTLMEQHIRSRMRPSKLMDRGGRTLPVPVGGGSGKASSTDTPWRTVSTGSHSSSGREPNSMARSWRSTRGSMILEEFIEEQPGRSRKHAVCWSRHILGSVGCKGTWAPSRRPPP